VNENTKGLLESEIAYCEDMARRGRDYVKRQSVMDDPQVLDYIEKAILTYEVSAANARRKLDEDRS
jgi:hypothetical protein